MQNGGRKFWGGELDLRSAFLGDEMETEVASDQAVMRPECARPPI